MPKPEFSLSWVESLLIGLVLATAMGGGIAFLWGGVQTISNFEPTCVPSETVECRWLSSNEPAPVENQREKNNNSGLVSALIGAVLIGGTIYMSAKLIHDGHRLAAVLTTGLVTVVAVVVGALAASSGDETPTAAGSEPDRATVRACEAASQATFNTSDLEAPYAVLKAARASEEADLRAIAAEHDRGLPPLIISTVGKVYAWCLDHEIVES